jgi:predicted nucleic acid-binding protein
MRFIDSTILLCFMIKKPKEYFDGCKKLILRLQNGREKCGSTIITVAEIVWVLESRENWTKGMVLEKVAAIHSLRGLRIIEIKNHDTPLEAMTVAQKFDTDFADALTAVAMNRAGVKEVYSLDPHFDRFKFVRRVLPT